MTMQRWEPFKEMITLRNAMDKLFDDSVVRPSVYLYGQDAALPLDVYQTANDVVVKASLPGFKPEEVDISITGDTVTIKGEHKEETETKEKEYWLQERHYGSFSRSFTLPVEIQSNKAEASFQDGVLKLTLPKAEEVKPKQIKVKTNPMIEGEKKK
jgi:HSP20 family protein